MDKLIDSITLGDCRELLQRIPKESVHLCLSDIPYGINFDDWDVLHQNTNRALLGQSPAQKGRNAFKRRENQSKVGTKPIARYQHNMKIGPASGLYLYFQL